MSVDMTIEEAVTKIMRDAHPEGEVSLCGTFACSRLSGAAGYVFAMRKHHLFHSEAWVEWVEKETGRRVHCPLSWLRLGGFKVRVVPLPTPLRVARRGIGGRPR